ncbi:RmlC-like cupin [Plenodomus tracheiphilus IPT5]|uniref:RmlC-like cupin n=1 Tax=Plenodomus tracheiphilus IPT5 TaxID=1408161 RepID=A0A6A7APT3_9PLEO|nr:RmlC-like cupin [Plenodomus tracheiphilus IPT5]
MQLPRDFSTPPTALDHFRRLLVLDEVLLTGQALRDVIVFDFNGAQPASGALGGTTKAADTQTYPYSAGLDLSMTVVNLKPCGINTPHIHPRAAELLILIEGSNVRFGSIVENGLVKPGENQEIAGVLNRFEMTAFSQGSMHYQFNDGCQDAVLVAALGSGNPGTNQMTNLFHLNSGVVNTTLGAPSSIDGSNVDEFRKSIPANLAQDVKSCLARCGPR